MTLFRPALSALAAMTLAACVVGPDFRTPAFPAAASALPPAPMPAWPEWWTPFASPKLDALMREALAGNRDLLAAQARWSQSLARAGATEGDAGPQFDVEAGAGREKYGAQFLGPQDVPAFHYWSVTATASWFLDYLGGERRAAEHDRAIAAYQRHQLDAAYLGLTGNILIQAMAAAAARDQISAAEAILDRDRQLVALSQTAYEAGDATRIEVITLQHQLARDRSLLPPLQQDLAHAEHALAVLVGRSAADWTPPELRLADLPLPAAPNLPSDWLRARPDILAAEAQLHAATAAVGVATADLYPRIRLGASFGPQTNTLSDLFDESILASSLVAGITAPIFDGGSLRARRDAARSAMQATLAQYEQTVLLSLAQVADLLAALEHDASLIEGQLAVGEASRARLALLRQSHAAGNSGLQPILDAERTGQLAQLGHVRGLAQQREDLARLILALGGGLPAPEVSTVTAPGAKGG